MGSVLPKDYAQLLPRTLPDICVAATGNPLDRADSLLERREV